MDFRVVGTQAGRRAILVDAAGKISGLGQRGGEPGMGVGIVGVQFEGLAILRPRSLGITGLQKRAGQGDMNFRIARRQRQRRAIFLGGFAECTVQSQRIGEIDMRVSIVRMRADFGAIFRDGFGNPPGGFFQRADVHVDAGKVRAQAQHFPILFQRFADFLLRGVGISEIVMRFSIVRA